MAGFCRTCVTPAHALVFTVSVAHSSDSQQDQGGKHNKNSQDLMSVYKEVTLLCATLQLLCAEEEAIPLKNKAP